MDERSERGHLLRPLYTLAREAANYEAHRDEWLRSHEGEFVVLRGAEALGFFATHWEAREAAFHRFGVVPMLVKQVAAADPA